MPRIVRTPPGPASRRLAGRAVRFEPAPVTGIVDGAIPIGWARARGANVVDVDGNRFVDLTAGFGAASVGHRNPAVVAAVERATGRMIHGLADAATHRSRVDLAGRLIERGPLRTGRVFFASSGAEAVDVALRTVHAATGRAGVVAFDLGYHGTGLGALRATGRPAFRCPIEDTLEPTTLRVAYPHCFRCPYQLRWPSCGLACLDAALAEVDAWNGDSSRPRLGAWIVEPVAGREGVIVPPRGYLRALGAAARERGLAIVADEILTGGGRTGRWWASGPLRPDLVTVGKGITGGMPLAAVLGRTRWMKAWEGPGEARHTTTALAHPVSVAATLAALREIERRDLPGRARRIGNRLRNGLRRLARRFETIGEVRGVGAMWGIDFVKGDPVRTPDPAAAVAVADGLIRRGYVALAGGARGNVVSWTPPLTITDRQIDGALGALEAALEDGTPART